MKPPLLCDVDSKKTRVDRGSRAAYDPYYYVSARMRLGSFWSRVAFLVVLYWGSDSGSDREWLCSAARLSGLNPTRGVVLMPWVVMACLLLLVRALRGGTYGCRRSTRCA